MVKIISVTRILDEVGRLVFPQEARKVLGMKEGVVLTRVAENQDKTSEKAIDAINAVKKKHKIRYIYDYLDKLYSGDYKSKSKP
ncbi:hypothetical protein V1502_09985 [Bacillus sp. SCS-153A]|uniref:hypothetical protein n=1 Tax=Rossellomorea sedimentorum TaxID=3115294 RepID=UPI003906B453